MRGTILLLLQYVFMAWCLVKHRDYFAFYLYQQVDVRSSNRVQTNRSTSLTELRTKK
jgi:hypothetical protein